MSKSLTFETRSYGSIVDIIKIVENRGYSQKLSRNIQETKTLCYCQLVSIFEIIQAAYSVLQVRYSLAACIIARSLLEHVIDEFYVALRDDVWINKLFSKYHLMTQYWFRDMIQYSQDEVPRVVREYREYVSSDYMNLIPKHKKSKKAILTSDEMDKQIKRKYLRGWSGQTFTDRANEVKRMIEPYFLDESDTRFMALENSEGDLFFNNLEKYFKFYSNYTHPTAYSSVPHFNPKKGSFEFSYQYLDKTLKMQESFLVLCCDESIRGFSITLGKEEGQELTKAIESTLLSAYTSFHNN